VASQPFRHQGAKDGLIIDEEDMGSIGGAAQGRQYLDTNRRRVAPANDRIMGMKPGRGAADTRHCKGKELTNMDRQTLSIMKACEVVGVSRRTIYNWISAGKVEYVRTAGGSIRIFADTLWRDPATVGPRASETDSASTPSPHA
jgi:excisionase family DNA binding protein